MRKWRSPGIGGTILILLFLPFLSSADMQTSGQEQGERQEQGSRFDLGSRGWILNAGGGYGVPYGGAGANADLLFTERIAATVGIGFGNGFRAVGGARFSIPFERDERFEPRITLLGGRVSGKEDSFGFALGGGTLFFLRENIFLNGSLYAASPEADFGKWDIGFALGAGVRLNL